MTTAPWMALLVFAAPMFAASAFTGTQAGGDAGEPECARTAEVDGVGQAEAAARTAVAGRPSPAAAVPVQAASVDTAAPDVDALLARAESVYDALTSMRARFHQTVEVPLLERRREMEGVWYQKGAGRFKMDFTDPPHDVIVADGEILWLFYPSTNPDQVIRTDLRRPAAGAGMVDLQGRIFEEAHERYEAEYGGIEEVSGEPTHLVRLTPLGESPYRGIRVWIDANSYLVRKFEITEANGTEKTIVLREHEPGAAIPDSIFHFEPPPGADVFEG